MRLSNQNQKKIVIYVIINAILLLVFSTIFYYYFFQIMKKTEPLENKIVFQLQNLTKSDLLELYLTQNYNPESLTAKIDNIYQYHLLLTKSKNDNEKWGDNLFSYVVEKTQTIIIEKSFLLDYDHRYHLKLVDTNGNHYYLWDVEILPQNSIIKITEENLFTGFNICLVNKAKLPVQGIQAKLSNTLLWGEASTFKMIQPEEEFYITLIAPNPDKKYDLRIINNMNFCIYELRQVEVFDDIYLTFTENDRQESRY